MFESPILVYSDYCNYCSSLINVLVKNPKIMDNFVKINIDVDPATKQRPHIFYEIQNALQHKISRVPTIIVDNGSYVLTGEEAFKWLEFEIKRSNESSLSPFNPNEMGSFSDQYSKFGSTDLHDATEQTFKFISRNDDRIYTPQESSVEQRDLNSKQKERESIDNMRTSRPPQSNPNNFQNKMETFNVPKLRESDYSALMNQRQMSIQHAPKQNIDFTNFGFANQNGQRGSNSALSNKQKEMERKLEELLSQREEFTPNNVPSVGTEDIDWTMGTIKR